MDSAHADEASFAQAHTEFVQKRLTYLRTVQAGDLRRRARIVAWSAPFSKPEDTHRALAQVLLRISNPLRPRQDQLVEHFACIARLDHGQRDAGIKLKLRQQWLGQARWPAAWR